MITLHLQPLFAARGIDNPYSFLTRHGFSHNTANNLINGKLAGIKFNYLERLCELLWCAPHDVLQWKPAADRTLAEDHPLLPLMHKAEADKNFRKMMSKVPYDKLNDIWELLKKEAGK